MKGKTVSLIVTGILISFLIVGCGMKKGSEEMCIRDRSVVFELEFK